MSLRDFKRELRERIREEIAALPGDYIAQSDAGIFAMVTTFKEFIDSRNILIYCSVEREPDTAGIAGTAFAMGKTVAFPCCYGGGIMRAGAVGGIGELVPAILGIPAPKESAPVIMPDAFDLIIVPALTYDYAGYRIGYGGGYFDRYLRGLPAFTIGLAREHLLMDTLPREPHDIAVKCVVTEKAAMRIPAV